MTVTDTCNLKISFASNYFYDFGLGLPKLSMLAFYWTFFDLNRHRTVRKLLLLMTAFLVACYLTSLFDDTFFCGKDVSVQWSQEEGACSVFYAQEPFILNFTLGLTCYLVVYMLPATLLIRGILETSTGVILILAMGALPIVTGIVRFICLKVGTGQENLVCRFDDCYCTTASCILTRVLHRCPEHGRIGPRYHRRLPARTKDALAEGQQRQWGGLDDRNRAL
jgi:hypothetical protein